MLQRLESGEASLAAVQDVLDRPGELNNLITGLRVRCPSSGLCPHGCPCQVAQQLRSDHVYRDTIARLQKVADDRGDGEQVQRWLRRGYVPETAFYHFVGEPERVLFRSPS